MSAPLLDIATAPGPNSRHWKAGTTTWAEVCAWADEPRVGRKEGPGYVLGLLEPTTVDHPDPGAKKDCTALHRNKDAVVSRCVLALDADHLTPVTRDALLVRVRALGCAVMVYSTYSSTPEAPKLRILVLASRPVMPDEYRVLVGWLMERLGGVVLFDRTCAEPERFMYMPTRRDAKAEYYSEVIEGEPYDVEDALFRADLARTSEEIAKASSPTAAPEGAPAASRNPRPLPEDVVKGAVKRALRKLDALAALPKAARLDGDGWDKGPYFVAKRLVKAANSGTAYTLADAEADFMAHAPASEGKYDPVHKWKSAVKDVGDEALPYTYPEDDFTPWDVEPGEVNAFTQEVEREAYKIRVREAARDLVGRERQGGLVIAEPVGLAEFLAEPDEEVRYRVDGLWPTNGRVVLSAPNKAGKTTFTGNLTRSLVDGDLFLDQFAVERAKRVVLIDNELAPNMIRLWLREQGIKNVGAVDVLSLRGRLSSFDLLDPATRARWAAAIGPADVLMFDCLRPALDALALSEDKEAGRFLEALDELTLEARIRELLVVQHMGHTNERSRGDSRLLDWPDAVWKIVREDADDPQSPRYFSAYGRDVEQPEARLSYSDFNRRLSINGGSRREAKNSQVEIDVLGFVGLNPGCSQTAIEQGVTADRMTVRFTIRALQRAGRIKVEHSGQKSAHTLVEEP